MNASIASTALRGLIARAIFGAVALSLNAMCIADPSSAAISVKFADLNISKPSDARVLYGRIRAAALDACSYFWFERDADAARCVHDAIANAVTKINQRELSAVFTANNKPSVPKPLLSESRALAHEGVSR